jgi:23S rRNA pseudouridine1911/1915/1917 synthase
MGRSSNYRDRAISTTEPPFDADPDDLLGDAPPDDGPELRTHTVDVAGHGERLDKVLVTLAPEFSRSHLQGLVERGHVQVDGEVVALASRRLKLGQRIALELVPTAESLAFRPEPMALDVVFEDEHVLVLDKPAGLVVHPAAGNWTGTLLNGLLAHHALANALPRAGIVHRLDKDTSGLMVVGKTLAAVTALSREIAARTVRREYLALALGEIALGDVRVIEAPIGRDPVSRVRMAVVAAGRPARTDVQALAVGGGVSAVRCTLHTGRTHQIRVHMAHIGHPLVGDATYGGRPLLGMLRQALHAHRLSFAHPVGRQPLDFQRPPPADLAAAWATVVPARRTQ